MLEELDLKISDDHGTSTDLFRTPSTAACSANYTCICPPPIW